MNRQQLRSHYLRTKYFLQSPAWSLAVSNRINFLWYDTKNWGDALNPVLIEYLSGKKARGFEITLKEELSDRYLGMQEELYLVIGSTLRHADSRTTVWGAGFTSNLLSFREPPKKILAVRGPLSAAHIRSLGVDCPDIFGDPALLLPRFYRPTVTKQYRLGIVPHYLDHSDPVLSRFSNQSDVLTINIKDPIETVVKNLCRCEAIVSSSLHGLIAADAYGIPSKWIEISQKIPGKRFKFYDYFASLGIIDIEPFQLDNSTSLADLLDNCPLRPISINLDRLLEVCPFSQPQPYLH